MHTQMESVSEDVAASGRTLTGLRDITTYSIQIAAVNSAGIGPYSAPVHVKTPARKLVATSSNE